jgi:hypothetical protein
LARSYHVAAAAFAASCPAKWVDNLLSHHSIEGVTHSRQGTTREISPDALLQIVLIRSLVDELDLPVHRAVALAAAIAASPHGRVILPRGFIVEIDVATLRERTESRLLEAVESVVRGVRGRPRADGP